MQFFKYFGEVIRSPGLTRAWSEGMFTTIQIFFFTLLFSLPLGLLFTSGTMSRRKLISAPFKLYILIMRGTPLILQIFAIYFVLPGNFGRISSCILAFTLNYAAYFAEIFRGGILSIERGQYEAGKVLGFTKAQVFFRIALPQVIKRILLPVSNEVITLVKDTALATSIAIVELYRIAKNEMNRSTTMAPLLVAALFYLLMNALITLAFSSAERRLDYYKS